MADLEHYSPFKHVFQEKQIEPQVSIIAVAYRKNEEGEVEVKVYNSLLSQVEIQHNQVLEAFDSLNLEPLQIHLPKEKYDEENLTAIR